MLPIIAASFEANGDDLRVLAGCDPVDLAEQLGTRASAMGRVGRTKAEVTVDAAAALVGIGVVRARDLDPGDDAHRRTYLGVSGTGWATWFYLCMLLGHPNFKTEAWVVEFVREALGPDVDYRRGELLLHRAAAELGVAPGRLDQAVWNHQRVFSR